MDEYSDNSDIEEIFPLSDDQHKVDKKTARYSDGVIEVVEIVCKFGPSDEGKDKAETSEKVSPIVCDVNAQTHRDVGRLIPAATDQKADDIFEIVSVCESESEMSAAKKSERVGREVRPVEVLDSPSLKD